MDTLFVGRNIIFLPEVESTNSYAISMLKNVNIAEGTLIQTDDQLQGRVQRGNAWYSEKGRDLITSFVFKPVFLDLNKQFVLYEITALAVYDLLAQYLTDSQFDIKIKWPNDILVNEKKVAGILIENIIAGNSIQYSIVGIGINLNQQDAPNAIRSCSVQSLTGKITDLKLLTQLLCSMLEKYYLLLKSGKLDQIHSLYMDQFFKRGAFCSFEIDGKISEWKVMGTAQNGLLELQDGNGKHQVSDVKQVKWIY